MKRPALVIGGFVLGGLVLLCILVVAAGPLWHKLGVKPVCIQGDWPRLRLGVCPDPAAARPVVTPRPLPTHSSQAPIPVIVDDDGSPDGVIALLYMLRHPHYDVQAVTVSCGEAHPDIFARHLAHLLAVMGHSDIPVGAGRDAPLEGNNAFPDPWRRASDDFWGLDLPQASHPAEPVPAAQLIVHILSTSTQPVLLLVTGNHTNLAEALRLQPDIADRILGVHVMGGSIHTPGNIETDWPDIHNRVAEWNIWVDPKAASEVLAAGLPVGITPLDATNQVTWNRSDALAWASSPLPEARLAAELLEWMLDSWSVSGVFVWDLVAALDATDPDLCPEAWLALEVVTEPGPEQGRTAVTGGPPNAAVCLNPDADQIRARAASILGR